ncbi:HSP20-like chaperone [Lasallia pustulata]|uniref:HSP20-like chaperone n=1 Tax=Lasallia pustulata TaxID=136370 RepID=A0A1W5D551_9LECA|nr:HSP20-like chaperone [Lasallia pustulata]
MPSIRYFNQTAPFWDFVASLENSGADRPFFAAFDPESREANEQAGWDSPPTLPGGPDNGAPRGRHPPPPEHDRELGPPPHCRSPPLPEHDREGGPSFSRPPPPPEYDRDGVPPFSRPPPPPEHDRDGPSHHPWVPPPFAHHGPPPPGGYGWGRPHHHERRGGPHRGDFGGHRRGGCRGRGGFPFGGPSSFDMNAIAQFFAQQLGGDDRANATNDPAARETDEAGPPTNRKNAGNSKDFTPRADVFDTEDAYVIHLSLPGAKKENVDVSYDADKSEVSVAGVITRPGDEAFLKTLALDEREVGVFERKVRLGSRAHPAGVEVEGIHAKMEDGILIITVPKVDREYVDVTKVDIE